MLQSMTGYARTAITLTNPEGEKSTVTISLKSLNYRFFETTCKLPYQLSYLENTFIKLFKKNLHRGHIYFTIYMSNPNIFRGTIEPSLSSVRGYLEALETIKKQNNITDPITIDNILRLPNIFAATEQELDEQTTKKITDATNDLIEQIIKVRTKEGEHLQADLEKLFASMTTEIASIEQASAQQVEAQKAKVNDVVKELENDESQLAHVRKDALYALLDKIDIHEEIVRFKSHLERLKQILNSPEVEKGKRLDFTLQELAREINTITAKCSNADISKQAIDIKVEIEKAREQVQNIV